MPCISKLQVLAEVWVVWYGFILARELGIHYLIVKLGDMEIVLAFNSVSCPNILICSIVHACKKLVQNFHGWSEAQLLGNQEMCFP